MNIGGPESLTSQLFQTILTDCIFKDFPGAEFYECGSVDLGSESNYNLIVQCKYSHWRCEYFNDYLWLNVQQSAKIV